MPKQRPHNSIPQRIELGDRLDLVFVLYLRVSKDDSGRERSPGEQHDEALDHLPRLGGTLHDRVYVDVGTAWQKRRKRPDFDELLADLEGGKFPGDVLMIWDASRGSRRVGEWVRVLDACEMHGIGVYVISDRRLYDPSASSKDWRSLMDGAVDAEYEARKTSERVERSSKGGAKVGSFSGGRRPFGFAANGVTPIPVEQHEIRRLVKAATRGASIRSLAKDMNDRGVLTTAGNPWHPGVLRNMLTSARIIGMRVHQGEIVGRAEWAPIVTEAQQRRMVAVLARQAPVGRRGRTPWLLTGTLVCGLCGAYLVSHTTATSSGGAKRYACRKAPGYKGCGRVSLVAEPVETLVGDLVSVRLSDPDARSADAPDDDPEQHELDELSVRRTEIHGLVASGDMSPSDSVPVLRMLADQCAAVERRIAAKLSTTVQLDFVDGRSWDELPTAERQRVITQLIDRVTVAPTATRGRHVFDHDRLTVVWLDAV